MSTPITGSKPARSSAMRMIGWLAVASMLAVALLGPSAGSALGADLNPVDGTNDCPDGLDGFKIDETANHLEPGVYTHGGYSVTIYDVVEDADEVVSFSFKDASDLVMYVFVKGGQADGNYDYRPGGVLADEGLGITNGLSISHISFCFGDAPPSEPPSNPPSEPPSNPPSEPPSNPPSEPPSNPPSEPPPSEEPSTPPTGSEEPTQSEAPSPSFSGGVNPITGAPTLPPTDGIGAAAQPGSDTWRVLLVVMAALLASIMVLTPSRSSVRR